MQNPLSIEEIINKLDVKIKNLGSSKDTIKRMKRQGTVWKKISDTCITNDVLVSRLY